jgi:hypothetical protein
MPALSPTQAIVLMKASDRSDGNILPLPGSLRGGAASKVVQALLSRGLIRETISEMQVKPDAALNTVWRNEPDGRCFCSSPTLASQRLGSSRMLLATVLTPWKPPARSKLRVTGHAPARNRRR